MERAQLDKILADHKAWVERGRTGDGKASLQEADEASAALAAQSSEIERLTAENARLREALDAAWAWMDDTEVEGALMIAAMHHSPGSDRVRDLYQAAKRMMAEILAAEASSCGASG